MLFEKNTLHKIFNQSENIENINKSFYAHVIYEIHIYI